MDEEPNAMQRLMDSPITLLVIGMVVILICYTGWGMFEILTIPEARLP